MGEFMVKIVEMLWGESEEKRQTKLFQFKSFAFLALLLVLFSNMFWDMKKSIRSMLNEKMQIFVLNITRIGVHLFTSLVIIAFIIFVISAIVFEILDKVSNNIEKIDYFHRLRIGSSFRFSNSLENVLILLMVGYIFDNSFINEYTAIYSEYLWICIFIACGLQFLFSSSIGVLNSFFVFWIPSDIRDKKQSN